MNDTNKITKADVENAWKKFMKYTETAEQHEFPLLAMFQFKLEPFYKDLMENWDDHHADIFINAINKVLVKLGIK